MDSSLKRLIRSFDQVPVVKKGDYHYFVHPLSDGIPEITPGILDDAAECIKYLLPEPDRYDLLLTAEAMGIPITTKVSMDAGKPFSIVRKREYGLDGEVKVYQSTGYSISSMHLNLPPGRRRVVLIDDVLSTGGTLISITRGIRKLGMDVVMAIVLFNKMGVHKMDIESRSGYEIRSILDVEMVNGKFEAKPSK